MEVIMVKKADSKRADYRAPQVLSLAAGEVLADLGPAQAIYGESGPNP
jgi:hypothetical protein